MDQIKDDELSGTCSTQHALGGDKCIQNFSRKTWKEEATWKRVVNGRIILKGILKKQYGKVWTVFGWLLWRRQWTLVCHKRWEFLGKLMKLDSTPCS